MSNFEARQEVAEAERRATEAERKAVGCKSIEAETAAQLKIKIGELCRDTWDFIM